MNFSHQGCEISSENVRIIMRGLRTSDNCHVVESSSSPSSSFSCNMAQVDEAQLRHQRLGHVNYMDLSCVSVHRHLKGLPKVNQMAKPVCVECQKGKQIRSSHKMVKSLGSSTPLKLLHMDLVGPTQRESRGGKKYFLVVVDDYSRYTRVSFLREKSDAFLDFKKIVKCIQVEKGTSIDRIKSDQGGQFENSLFKKFYDLSP